MIKYVEKSAVVDGPYRYLLKRVWEPTKPRHLYIMLNPSTADALVDDPTIKSCYRISNALGAGSFEVVNLFAWRATDPNDLIEVDSPYGPNNNKAVRLAVNRCDLVILAWGAHPMGAAGRFQIEKLLELHPNRSTMFVKCLGKTKAGAPRHPLYVKTGAQLQAWY